VVRAEIGCPAASEKAPAQWICRRLPSVVTQLVVDESVVREKSDKRVKIEAVARVDIGRDQGASTARGSNGWEEFGMKLSLILTAPLTMAARPGRHVVFCKEMKSRLRCNKVPSCDGRYASSSMSWRAILRSAVSNPSAKRPYTRARSWRAWSRWAPSL
jgi:hypothetical protein